MELGRTLVYGNVFVSACAASLVVCTLAEAGAPVAHPLVGLVACATLFVYSLDRAAGVAPEDRIAMSSRLRWLENHQHVARVMGVLGACGMGGFSLLLPPHLLLPLIPLGLISVAYGVPALPWRGRWIRLKDIPGLKIFLISVVWATATVTLPLMSVGEAWMSPHAWGLFARRALFIFAITLPFDVRDAERDAGAHVRTLPHILGNASTRTLAWGLMVCCLLLDVFNAATTAHLLGSACAVAWTCALLFPMTRPRHDMYYACGLDGTMLVHTACLLIALSW